MISLEECSSQQLAALDQVAAWYDDPLSPQVFKLWGFAGTGKTSLAQLAADKLGADACYAAFTGKAAHVLRTKGCVGAQTIHSLIYQPAEQTRARLVELERRLAEASDAQEHDELAATIRVERAKLGQVAFILKDESDLDGADLLILDEASMVNAEIGMDLESFGVKILVLGDPMQLPPIDGAGYYTNQAPDVLLDEVHRSEWDSPVTRIATAIRTCPPGDASFGVSGADGRSGRYGGIRIERMLGYDQVLVGANRTRWRVIRGLRAAKGFPPGRPVAGDRIIILANNTDVGVFNGQQWTVVDCRDDRIEGRLILSVVGDKPRADAEPERRTLTVWSRAFAELDDKATRDVVQAGRRGRVVTATFAQAITTHKAQGSQWDSVLVVDESRVFRDMAQRWLYTAATRAAKQVVIVGTVRG